MTPDFKAAYCESADEDDYSQVWLGTEQSETLDYLTFQRAHEFDEQDIRLGLDGVYVERNDQGFSGYRGMRNVVLFRDRLHIDFDERGTRFMGGIPAMDVVFEFSDEVFSTLRRELQKIFRGYDYFHDNSHA